MIDSTAPDIPTVALAECRAGPPATVSSLEAVARSRLVTVGMTTLLAEVAALLAASQISLVVVCDATGSVVGVITESILVRQLGFGNADVFTTQADEVMNRDFTACAPSDSLSDVLAAMHTRGLVHVLIVEA